MIELSKGLENSLIVLKHLRNKEAFKKALKNIDIVVGTFTNCRECGLTFMVMKKGATIESFTWCIYEHRNSNEIIINGKEGYISMSDELPYKGNKFDYLDSFQYDEHEKCAKELARRIVMFHITKGR